MGKSVERIARLSPQEQRALLGQLFREKAQKPKTASLSFAQERLWFLHQLEPGNPFYNMPTAIYLTGQLDVTALQQSLNEIVCRHETLRTTFAATDGRPVQVIALFLALPLPLVDLRLLPVAGREREARRLVVAEAKRPFDLARGPLFRANLLRLGNEEYTMLLNVPHIISDGWSQGVLLRELTLLYKAFANGQSTPLSQLPVQYADFARWQRQWLQGEALDTLLAYWRKQLGGTLPVLELPADRPRPPAQSFRGARQPLAFSSSLSTAIKVLSQREGVTLFVTLLAAFKALLYHYTRQADIVVGSSFAGRNRPETEGLIGFFINTLVLRTDLSGNPTFRDLLERVGEVTLQALAHQDMPFEKLVEELQPERDMSRAPLFQVLFFLQNAPMDVLELPGLILEPMEIDSGTAKFDLTLSMWDTEQGLRGALEYNTDLFDATTIARLLGHFQTLLEGVSANPEQRLFDLPLLTDVERQQTLTGWNDTQTDYPQKQCIHEWFETQVEQTPDSVAVVFPSASFAQHPGPGGRCNGRPAGAPPAGAPAKWTGRGEDQHLTYRELNCRANQLARYLLTLGVGPEALVGICLERSLEMVVGLLGILKAGGAYVPLDPAYPNERLAFMLEDTQTTVLLSQARLVAGLPRHQAQVVCLGPTQEMIAHEGQKNPLSGVTADNLAYVIYTSGSTGKPKGAMNTHGGIRNRLFWMQDAYQLTETDRVLQKTPFSFDVSVWEFFWPLLEGACLVVARPEGHQDSVYLLRLITEQKVTTLHFVPSMLQVFLEEQGLEACSGLRRVICSGEALPFELQERFFARLNTGLHNLYGPTEASIDVTFWTCQRESKQQLVPIGRPIANTHIYLLDQHLNPVPVGVPGELHIGGAGLARGYLDRPELTATKFTANPFSREPGARLYRTGDLARYLPDGNIEFLSRIDHQVKIRGFRIELGEIESALRQHPDVREAVVLARKDKPGEKQLVAYVVSSDGQALNVSELRSFLKAKLPEYMLPSACIPLKTLPLMPNGKVDRRALPAPDRIRPELEQAFVAPRTSVEEALARIWTQVLGVEQVGVYDNFFELGGHSLLATQVISRIRQTFQIELPLRDMFKQSNISSLAATIEATCRTKQGADVSSILPAPRAQALLLSFAQQRLWFLDQWEPGNPAYNIPAAVRLTGRLNVPALEQSLNEVVRRHEGLRTTFSVSKGRPVQTIAPATTVPLPILDLQALPDATREAHVRRLTVAAARWSFDLARDPLLRASLLKLEPETHVLLLNTHHIVSDGWSVGILIQELAALYRAFSARVPSPLPDLPIQYADFALWQRRWLRGEVLERQLAYWKEQLAHAPAALDLPTDHPRPATQTYHGAVLSFELSEELSKAIKALGQQHEVTLFMTLLAAFQVLLHRYTGQTDIVVGSPIANRNRGEIEGLIGFFVNTLALRTDLAGNPTFWELLQRVREVTLDAYAHQDLPFEMLVEELQPVRDPSHTPLFQAMFVLYDSLLDTVELPGLTLAPLQVDSGMAKFDLTLSLVDRKQGLRGMIEYNTDLFEVATIRRMVGHFQTLLHGLVSNPNCHLLELPLLTEAERHQILAVWNNTRTAYPQDQCLHQLFETQVTRTPDALAVTCGEQHLTYRELNCRANRLARHLQKLGVGPGVLVGLCVERSLDAVVGLYGILKAGGAYVPLDAAYPPERLAFMLESAHISILLTQQRLLGRLPAHEGQVISLDADWQIIAQESQDDLGAGVTPNHLMYVIYTSGSTGRPKGAGVYQGGFVNLLNWFIKDFALGASDSVYLVTSLSFDLTQKNFYAPLLGGGALHLLPNEYYDPREILDAICDRQATWINCTPSAFYPLLDEGAFAKLASLRYVFLGGEPISTARLRKWIDSSHCHAEVVNTYGPTECTDICAFYRLKHPRRFLDDTLPTGSPIYNAQVFILDRNLSLLPVGQPGELCVAGTGVGLGYVNDPAMTAEKFVPLPSLTFSSQGGAEGEGGARLYRTGDLVRYLPDGNVEFIGRMDHQVKLRGFRIELGEIEAVLGQHPAVQEAVALVREDRPADKYLVAYVVPEPGPTPTPDDLREFLRARLSDYMLPSVFTLLKTLPLTPNGKVDRRALPAPERARSESRSAFVPPRTAEEQSLADIWGEVLGIERVGIYDNFFALGGHSLLATQVISRVRDAFRVELPLRELFAAPTVADLAGRIERARGADQGGMAHPILPVSRDADAELPLSFAQQRLWFLDQLEPDSAAYNIPLAVQLSGRLDVPTLAHSLNEIVSRHEPLRTAFVTVDGQPLQIISPDLTLTMPVVDLAALPEAGRQARARQLAVEEAQRPFDLSRSPLIRVTLLRLGGVEYVLLLNMHHVVSDGWSMNVLVRELGTLYRALCDKVSPLLADLPTQYADFAAWQRAWLQGEVLEAQLSYWKEQLGHDGSTELAKVPPVLELPTDHPRPPLQTFRGAYHTFRLPEALPEALKALSQREGATLFMTLLAAFKALLHRYTGQTDVAVGSPIANRNHSQIEGLIGFFVNTLVLRTDLSDQPTFRELLRRVREVALGAYAHQDVPFEMLVDELQPERNLSHPPLFQVLFVLQNAPLEPLQLPGLTLSLLETRSETSKFDLTLSLVETAQGLQGELEYNCDLFEAGTIARLAVHYERLLDGIISDPDQRLWELSLLSAEERQRLLGAWNETQLAYPTHLCLHQLFEAQAGRTPDAIALVFKDQHLTYADLDLRAGRLAQHLRGLGVGPESLVAICAERLPDVVLGVLGALQAGAAYVPLDPHYPPERTAFILADTQAPVLLTQRRLVERLPEHNASVVYLDAGEPIITSSCGDVPIPGITAQHLAYVIYTSGSTGQPKGVAIQHRSAVALVQWALDAFDQASFEGVLASTSLCFDLSIFELFVPLSCGGAVILAQDLLHLPELPAAGRVTLVNTVPSALAELLRLGDLPHAVRTVNLAGEPLQTGLVAQLYEQPQVARVFDLYGPSEDTTYSTYALRSATGPETIGRPVANSQVYLLDGHLNPVPVGVPGELYLGGAGLARGYLHRPAQTAGRFVPNPFASRRGRRLYKTGDLARYLPDGQLQFLGRLDHQVKLRGFRIELGEIETVLRQHPQVQEAVALVREDQPGDKRLVAYVVGTEPTPTATELRRFLHERLPEYMIPSAFVTLDALPLTPNGKVDRRALPAPEGAGLDLDQTPVAPRDALELRLARIWEQVLGERPVGVTHNFFELGGHSLLAVRLVARIRQELGHDLPLAVLFSSPTVERLAVLLRQCSETLLPFSALVSLQAGQPDRRPLFLVHPGGGNVFCYADLVRHLDPEQPCYGLQARGLDKEQAPHTRVEAMASYYLEWVRTVQAEGPYQLGGWSVGGVIAFEMAQQLQARGQEVVLLALIDSHAPTGVEPEPDDVTLLGGFALDLGLPLQRLRLDWDDLRALSTDERLAMVLKEAKRAQVIPGDVGLAQVRYLLRVFKNNVQVVRRYVARRYAGPLVLFKAQEQRGDSAPDLGWRAVAGGGLAVQTIPGDHYTLVREPHVAALAGHIQRHLCVQREGK